MSENDLVVPAENFRTFLFDAETVRTVLVRALFDDEGARFEARGPLVELARQG